MSASKKYSIDMDIDDIEAPVVSPSVAASRTATARGAIPRAAVAGSSPRTSSGPTKRSITVIPAAKVSSPVSAVDPAKATVSTAKASVGTIKVSASPTSASGGSSKASSSGPIRISISPTGTLIRTTKPYAPPGRTNVSMASAVSGSTVTVSAKTAAVPVRTSAVKISPGALPTNAVRLGAVSKVPSATLTNNPVRVTQATAVRAPTSTVVNAAVDNVPITSAMVSAADHTTGKAGKATGTGVKAPAACDTATIKHSDKDDHAGTQGRVRSRKEALKPKNANPEMLFETIIVKERTKMNAVDRSEQIVQEVLRKPLKGKGKFISEASLKYIEEEFRSKIYENAEVQEQMHQVAEECVRINHILTTFGMREIDFKLGTPKEEMMLMFSDRLLELDKDKASKTE